MPAPLPFACVAGVGLLTPLGAAPEQILTALHAGVSAYSSSAFCNQLRLPMTTTQVPEGALAPVSEDLAAAKLPSRMLRLVRLALPALADALKNYSGAPIPMFLAGPEVLPNMAKPVTGNLIHYLLQGDALPIARAKCRYFASGRTGLLEAIDLAFQCFAQTDEPFILVGAVDTFIDAATLGQLDAEGRVLAEHISDGFAPGEGCGFLLLSRPEIADPLTHGLYRPGLAVENGHRYSEQPMLGQGLDQAVKQAILNAPPHTITDLYSTHNGESFFNKELGTMLIRNSSHLAADLAHHHPADALGDMGAATAAVLIAMAIQGITQTHRGNQLIVASADLGPRAAVCISQPPNHSI